MSASAKAAQTIEERATSFVKEHYLPDDKLCVALIDSKTGHIKQEIRTAKASGRSPGGTKGEGCATRPDWA